jgi:hypothetical protein
MLRKIVIGVALLIIVLVGVGIYFIHRLNSEMTQNSREALKKLQPRVITGAGRFDKNPFYAGSNLGEITQILVGWPADREGAALTVVGNEGAHFLDARAGLKMQIQFSKFVPCSVEVVRLDGSGDYGFLTRDQSWAVDVVLFDKTGQERWSYSGGLTGIDDSVIGDTGGNGKSKVIIGFNGSGGLVVLDGERNQVWKKSEGNVWHVEILDTRGDGRKEILHTNAQGQLLVREASGEVIAHYLPNYYVSDFALTRWGAESQPSHILVPTNESADQCCKPVLLVLDAQGRIVAHLDASLGDLMQEAKGTPVSYPRNVEYYAVLQSKKSLKRSVLSLYNHEGQIAYQEVLGDYCLGITALPGELGDSLLVGCSGKVWEYSAARAEVNSARARPAR